MFDPFGKMGGEELAVFFEGAAGFLGAFEIGPEDIVEGIAGEFTGEGDGSTDIELCFATSEEIGEVEAEAGFGEAMAPAFNPLGAGGIVSMKAEIFFDDTDTLAEAVDRSIDDPQGGDAFGGDDGFPAEVFLHGEGETRACSLGGVVVKEDFGGESAGA